MKKKMLSIIATIAAFALFVPSVMAAEPTYEEISYGEGKDGTLFFANGTPVTVEARTDGEAGALIKWGEDKELAVSEYSSVFGGSHESETKVESTSIIMNGGTLNNVFGGGLHASKVGTAYVEVNGGKVTTSVTGGGAAAFANTTCDRPWYSGNAKESTTRVDEAIVILNDGEVYMVYGGGEGISYTGETYVEINSGTYSYVTAGGSNGYTGEAELVIYNGTISVLQSVNRGSMDAAEIDVFGGTITNAYVGGETGDTSVNGTIADAYMYIGGGEVANVYVGTSGGEAASEVATLDYTEEAVDNLVTDGFEDGKINTNVYLEFVIALEQYTDSIGLEVPQNTDLTEFLDLVKTISNEGLADTGYEVVGFYIDENYTTSFDGTNGIDEDTTVYIKIAEVEEEKDEEIKEETKTEDKEENPETGDLNLALLIGTIVVGVAGAVIISKKRFAKNN